MSSRKLFLIALFAIQIVTSGTAIAGNCSRDALFKDTAYTPVYPGGVRALGSDGSVFAEVFIRFLKDRTRAEVSLWAQDRFGSRICGVDSKARAYFQRTCQAYDYAMASGVPMTLDAVFRRNIRSDLRDAPFCYMQEEHPDELASLLVIAHILEPLKGDNPDLAISNLTDVSLLRDEWKNAGKEKTFDALEKTGAVTFISTMKMSIGTAAQLDVVRKKAKSLSVLYKKISDNNYADPEDRNQDISAFLAASDELLAMLVAEPAGKADAQLDNDRRLVAAINMLMAMSVGEYEEALSEIWHGGYCKEVHSACAMLATAATMADAESEEQVRSILDTYASPVGSWRLKQAGPDRIASLSARVGVAYSHVTPDVPGDASAQGRYEPVGSVGVDYAIPQCFGHVRCGFQLQVVDLGAAFADPEREVSGGTIRKRSSDRLSGYVAPALAFYIGVTDSPIIVGASYGQYDNLYTFDDGVNPESAIDAKVVSFFIAADIMLFPF